MVDETVLDVTLDASASMIISEALSWIGTPYRHQASCKHAGCDCLGLIRGVYAAFWPEPEQPSAYNPNWAEANSEETLANAAKKYLLPVALDARAPSNILLFRYKRGFPAKHAGIQIDETHFLHAQDGAGVQLVSLSAWWMRHISHVFAFPPLPTASHTGIEMK
ncbi:NlpC/P60 family protein [uncultured Cohaesibacter sp.]|uniref:NlpC/P60 family protein n=1 Tax=uncultured Cohaesibacter sp. TaxID=1002546 RepID=UPI002AAB9F22|nr:NlpC/P60 family protein [uncultured Cohaesibacter sp.]